MLPLKEICREFFPGTKKNSNKRRMTVGDLQAKTHPEISSTKSLTSCVRDEFSQKYINENTLI